MAPNHRAKCAVQQKTTNSSLARHVQLTVMLPVLLLLLLAPWSADAESGREVAVLQARAGHVAEAITELRAMWARGSSDPLVPLDLAVLLQQASQSVEATSVLSVPMS
jgi:hypothetical protein